MSCHAQLYKIVINSYSKYYSRLSVCYRYRCHDCQLWSWVIRHLGQSKGPIAANPAKTLSAGTRMTKICVRQCRMQTDPNKREGVSTNKNYIDPPSAVFQYGLHFEPFTAHYGSILWHDVGKNLSGLCGIGYWVWSISTRS